MDSLKIGNGPSEIRVAAIERTMRIESSSFNILSESWKRFGRSLPITDMKISSLEKRLGSQFISLEEIAFEVLAVWKSEQGSKATVQQVYDALLDIGLSDVAECLEKTFCNIVTEDEIQKQTQQSNGPKDTSGFSRSIINNVDGNPLKIELVNSTSWADSLVDLIRQIVEYFLKEREPEKPLRQKKPKLHWIPDSTFLHVAANKGMFNIFMDMLQILEDDVLDQKYLLHACVSDSTYNSKEVIQDKVKIIEQLLLRNQDWMEELFDQCTPLLQPCIHLKILDRLVQLGANINAYSIRHGTALHRVDDKEEYLDILKWAKSNGFNRINSPDSKGWTPLIYAIKRFGDLEDETIDVLKETGADFNAEDNTGFPVLYHALWKSEDTEFISKIVENGANVNHEGAGPEKLTAAHAVLKLVDDGDAKEEIGKIELLIEKGFTKLDEKDAQGATPLHYAMEVKELDKEVLEVFQKNEADFNAADNQGDTILFEAIKNVEVYQNLTPLGKILEFGGNVNHESVEKNNAAHVVVNTLKEEKIESKKALEVLQFLSSKGFDKLNEKNHDGVTPFESAMKIENLDEEVFDFFYENRPNVDNTNMNSVLAQAIGSYQNVKFITKILDAGADVNFQTEKKTNAAHEIITALKNEEMDSCKALSILKLIDSKGFNLINAGDGYGLTPLHYAMHVKDLQYDILDYLQSRGASFTATSSLGCPVIFHAVMSNQNPKILRKMLDLGSDLNYVWKLNKLNPLHIATLCGSFSSMEFLIDKFPVNQPNKAGNTPLHMVFSKRNVNYKPILELLMKNGGNFNIRNKHGNVPLLHWIESNTWKDTTFFSTLVETKALITLTENEDISSRAFTALIGKPDLQKILLRGRSEDRKTLIATVFMLFLERGAKFQVRGRRFDWSRLDEYALQILSENVKVTTEFLQELNKKLTVDLSGFSNLSEVGLKELVEITKAEIEILLYCFLACKEYKGFVELCDVHFLINNYKLYKLEKLGNSISIVNRSNLDELT